MDIKLQLFCKVDQIRGYMLNISIITQLIPLGFILCCLHLVCLDAFQMKLIEREKLLFLNAFNLNFHLRINCIHRLSLALVTCLVQFHFNLVISSRLFWLCIYWSTVNCFGLPGEYLLCKITNIFIYSDTCCIFINVYP